MALNAQILAASMLSTIGGRVTPARQQVFNRLAEAIVNHIIQYGAVTVIGVQTGGGTVTTPGPGAIT